MANPVPSERGPAGPERQSAPATSGAAVTVACKLPHGIWLHRDEPRVETTAVLGGGIREIKVHRRTGERFRINGNAIPALRDPERDYPAIVGGHNGYALTHGVPADLWAAWLHANRDSDMVRNGLVFACDKAGEARDRAREQAEVRSGLEPLAKDGDPRMPRRVTPAAA